MKKLPLSIFRMIALLLSLHIFWNCSSSDSGPNPLTQIPDDEKMVLIYYVPQDHFTVKLPLAGTVECIIDWGDQKEEKVDFSQPVHHYEKSGLYQIKIAGTVTAINASALLPEEKKPLQAVLNWGKTGLKSLSSAFEDCTELTLIESPVTHRSFAEVTSFENTFSGCESLTEIPAGLFDDGIAVLSFKNTFARCKSLTEIPAGLFGNCPEATTFESTFTECTNLTEIPSALFRGCNKATHFDHVFSGCVALTRLPDQLFTSPAAESFRSAFADCVNLTEISEELFSRENYARLFDRMFGNCINLKKIPDHLFEHCLGAEYFTSAFAGCKSLTKIPSGLFDNCKRVKDFITTFSGCTNLQGESPYTIVDGKKIHLYERNGLIGGFKETIGYGCFSGCTGLTDYADMPQEWSIRSAI